MNKMADEGYKTSTMYQARIALFNMLDYAYQNDVILKNPCNKMVKYDMGNPSKKKTDEEKHKEIDKIAKFLKVI